jgi:hypothetical protein
MNIFPFLIELVIGQFIVELLGLGPMETAQPPNLSSLVIKLVESVPQTIGPQSHAPTTHKL